MPQGGSLPGMYLEEQGANMAGEKSVRKRVGLLKRFHLLSFTTWYLLSPETVKTGRQITEKTTKKRHTR